MFVAHLLDRRESLNELCQINYREVETDDWDIEQTKVVKFSHTWSIENFSKCFELKESWRSSAFPVDGDGNVLWHLNLVRKVQESTGRIYFTLNLHKMKANSDDKTTVRCSILNHAETEQKKTFKLATSHEIVFEPFIYGCNLFDETKNYLPDDKLTIYCEILLLTDSVCSCGRTNPIHMPDSKIPEDLGKFFNNPKFSDVTILATNGQTFFAHKNILSARCPVFEGMFNTEIYEYTENRVAIGDVEPEVLAEMLHFIYTDTAPNLHKVNKDLLAAADKYQLERLKVMCEKSLYRELNCCNAAEILVLADLYNALQLKARTIEFINENRESVRSTSGWTDLSINHNDLIKEHFLFEPPMRAFVCRKANYRKFSCAKCG